MLRLCTRSWSRKLLGCPLHRCCAHSMWTSRRRNLSGIYSWIILFEVQVLSMLRTILSAMVVGIGGDYSYTRHGVVSSKDVIQLFRPNEIIARMIISRKQKQ